MRARPAQPTKGRTKGSKTGRGLLAAIAIAGFVPRVAEGTSRVIHADNVKMSANSRGDGMKKIMRYALFAAMLLATAPVVPATAGSAQDKAEKCNDVADKRSLKGMTAGISCRSA